MLKPIIAQKNVTMHILQKFNIRTSKKLGQNFLVNESVVDQIVQAAAVTAEDTVLEIGPGIGTLTQKLAETGAEVVAVEIDRNLVEVLGKTLEGYENVRIVYGDILKIDISREISAETFKVAANLPYYITTPIIMELLEKRLPIELLVVMVQREVAERMVAKPGGKDYGALSVAVQYYTQPEIVVDVSHRSFIPEPEVESAVVRCIIRKQPPAEILNEKLFFRVVKAAFGQRRKTLSNALKSAGISSEVIEAAKIDGKRRGETLTLKEFADIANVWYESMKNNR